MVFSSQQSLSQLASVSDGYLTRKTNIRKKINSIAKEDLHSIRVHTQQINVGWSWSYWLFHEDDVTKMPHHKTPAGPINLGEKSLFHTTQNGYLVTTHVVTTDGYLTQSLSQSSGRGTTLFYSK